MSHQRPPILVWSCCGNEQITVGPASGKKRWRRQGACGIAWRPFRWSPEWLRMKGPLYNVQMLYHGIWTGVAFIRKPLAGVTLSQTKWLSTVVAASLCTVRVNKMASFFNFILLTMYSKGWIISRAKNLSLFLQYGRLPCTLCVN